MNLEKTGPEPAQHKNGTHLHFKPMHSATTEGLARTERGWPLYRPAVFS
jgi:hypothetical protein